MNGKKFKIIIGVIFIAIIGGVFFLLSEREPQERMVTGTIAEVNDEDNQITIWDNGSTTPLRITDQSVIETEDRKLTFDFLRVGQPATASYYERGTTDVARARWVRVTAEPDVLIEDPLPNQSIASPLEITGQARGTWFFEGSFSAKLQAESGDVIAEGVAQAEGDWMQEGYVPFSAELDFSNADDIGQNGTLVFEKANPSGLDENAAQQEMPVVFSGTQKVKVFFGRDIVGTNIIDCSEVFSTTRTIPETSGVARAALNELLAGPTEQEVEDRFITNIPDGVTVKSLEVRDGTAYADFSQALQENVGGSCRVQAIRSQIEDTLLQFQTVDSVEISIEGQTEGVLQP